MKRNRMNGQKTLDKSRRLRYNGEKERMQEESDNEKTV